MNTTISVNRRTLGKALGRIRRLRGLSREQCETALHVPAGTLRDAEAGALTESLIRALSRLHGLDAELLEEGQVKPVAGIEGSTVFLLHSGNQDFSADALASLEEGLVAGQLLCTSTASEAQAALATRSAFAPVAVAGPESRDAARQGYRLANRVRAVLSLGVEPLGDLGALLQARLGVAVFVPDFSSTEVEAASIVDAHRLAACAMISATRANRENPRMRMLLAHELCHILFDPARPGTVRLSVHASGGSSALEESRAKAFAAEFLLPREGLVGLLGMPHVATSENESREFVQRARSHFGTTSEIAVWHLKNHGFIDRDVAEQLVKDTVDAPVRVHTSLPATGELPAVLPNLGAHEAESTVELNRLVAKRQPSIDEGSARQLLSQAETTEDEFEATDALVLELDRHLSVGNTALLARVLETADCTKLRRAALGGLLLLARAAQQKLPQEAAAFRQRALKALEASLSPGEFEAVSRQFT